MSDAGGGAASGAVVGVVLVLIAQQLGWLSLSDLWPGVILYPLLGAIVGGIAGGLVGHRLARD